MIGDDDIEAVDWFTKTIVNTGIKILTGKPRTSTELKCPDDRIVTAVQGTFWRMQEGLYNEALVLHVYLRCGQKLSLNDPAIMLGSVNAAMTHDALSLLRGSEEEQDKSEASVLNVSRAVYGQTILFCVKMSDIVMRNICEANYVWTVIDNYRVTHVFSNITIKAYGVAERMLETLQNCQSDDGVCIPQINKIVVEYYCAVIREVSKCEGDVGPWKGKVNGAMDWLDASKYAVINTTMEPGRPIQVLAEVLSQNLTFRTPIGLELLQLTNGKRIAYIALQYSHFILNPHTDYRFVEAVAVLTAKLESVAESRDAGPPIPELSASIPQEIIDKAWDVIAGHTSCNAHRIQLLKDTYEQAVILRRSTYTRDFAKHSYEQLQSDTAINITNKYSEYIELRMVDGCFRFGAMINLAYETGRPEDVDCTGFMKIMEASVVFHEESSRRRRTIDDKGFGYWSCVSKDECKARAWGRNRANILWRQGWDEMATNGMNISPVYMMKSPMKHGFNGLPGTEPWLAFQQIIDSKT